MVRILVAIVLLCAAWPASARNTEHFYSVAEALRDGQGAGKVGDDVRFYFAGAEHPGVAKSMGVWETRKSTRGFMRSDKMACHTAFLSAILQLQARARAEGGNGVVDIVSITRGMETSSPTEYRCVAGSTVVHVGLKGRVVDLR
jgi:hypothetical protein